MSKIFLITGFLGSGKSTYINRLLSDTNKKVGVLINEFGNISVDTITLNKKGIDLIELTNGSIFCACLKDKFICGLMELLKIKLDEIYIEASGLSDPSNINSIIKILKKQLPDKVFELAGVICLVDAVYFLKQINILESIRRQIEHSHFIIINKIDLVDREQIENTRRVINEINPRAQIECVSYGKSQRFMGDFSAFNISSDRTTNTVSSRPMSMTLEFINPYSIDLIERFFASCKVDLYRAKGYVQVNEKTYKVDVVNKTIKVDLVKNVSNIKSEYINKIVLLFSKGNDSINSILKVINTDFSNLIKC